MAPWYLPPRYAQSTEMNNIIVTSICTPTSHNHVVAWYHSSQSVESTEMYNIIITPVYTNITQSHGSIVSHTQSVESTEKQNIRLYKTKYEIIQCYSKHWYSARDVGNWGGKTNLWREIKVLKQILTITEASLYSAFLGSYSHQY